jgi:hypothetical protein
VFRLQVAGRGVTFLVGPDAHQAFFPANDTQLSQKEVYGFTVPGKLSNCIVKWIT